MEGQVLELATGSRSLSSSPGAPLGPGRGSELSLEPSPLQVSTPSSPSLAAEQRGSSPGASPWHPLDLLQQLHIIPLWRALGFGHFLHLRPDQIVLDQQRTVKWRPTLFTVHDGRAGVFSEETSFSETLGTAKGLSFTPYPLSLPDCPGPGLMDSEDKGTNCASDITNVEKSLPGLL
ncbi:hypothetical protein DUI87_11906 [Hirundo rustica rustica]|uniref:Uncharacterized protein n=1 Tax=Hirundo rustica rustica TaxID=333673 RepID=A0A3M0KGR4_HIRRU|nr:hypothetical protein DUI87_11906 [Hirundo rustica rustica]